MRNELMKDFDKIYVVDLHGNARIGEISPDGMADQNVFDIMQGVCIILLIKNPNIKDKGVYHLDIFGKRKAKLKGIAETRQGQFTKLEIAEFNQNFRSTKWGQNRFQDDLSFFAPMREAKAMIEYGEFWGLTEIFEQVSGGVKTDRDELAIDFESQKLQEKMQIAFEGNYDNEFKEKYNITNSSSYNFADKLKQGNFDENVIHNIDYRPFDTRNIYYKQGFTSRPAFETMQHILKGENLGLIFMRGFTGTDSFNQIQISNNLVDINFYGFQTYFAPLYIYKDEKENKKDQQVTLDEKWENIQTKKPNFTKQFQEFIKTKFGNVSPEAVLGFIYSQMHSPVYRSKFLELLKIDFPRVNFEVSPQEFERLAKIGQEMIEIHLMKKIPEIETKIDCFAPDFDNVVVEKVRYNEVLRRVYLNEKTYFEKISPKVWNYKIGGYQVLDKYLKSRKDRLLSHEEIGHFKDVVRVLEWTIGVAEGLKQ
jgi:predicted helicase